MPFASLVMDDSPKYRWDAFAQGFRTLGYIISPQPSSGPNPTDVLVIWNRHRHHNEALKYEAVGAKVIVAENGYIGADSLGRPLYALALNYHNGPGRWPSGHEDRWAICGIKCQPWRTGGKHILVLPQRGIGPAGVAMPRNWPDRIVTRLRSVTSRNIVVRPHPGMDRPSLRPDLNSCWAAVTWGSGAAIKAIVAGIPVFYELEGWIGAAAAKCGIDDIENPFLGDREPMLNRLANAQWSVEEIATGGPLKRLLDMI
jgi:hypothetical protein